MFCKHCGAQVPDNAKFCASCGKPTGSSGNQSNPGSSAPPVNPSSTSSFGTGSNGAFQPTSRPQRNSGFKNAQPHISPVSSGTKVKIKKKYNIGNIILWVGCAIAILSLFFPYASASAFGFSRSTSLMEAEDGIYFLVVIAIVAILNLFKLNTLCVIGSVFTVFLINLEHQDLSGYGGLLEYGSGHTLLILGGVVMLLSAIAALVLAILQKKNARQNLA